MHDPIQPPTQDNLEVATLEIEERSCELREKVSDDLSEPASPEQENTARLIGRGALGMGALVADVAVIRYAPFIAVKQLSRTSMTWGWHQMKDVYSKLTSKDLPE